jgi:FkbM family methyltransferase
VYEYWGRAVVAAGRSSRGPSCRRGTVSSVAPYRIGRKSIELSPVSCYLLCVKNAVKNVLERVFGFERYLLLHAIFVAYTMPFRRTEGAVLHFIRRLPVDATVLDIGANIGVMTLLFSRRARRGRVLGFEPIMGNFHVAQRLLRLFRVANATLLPIGLGERDEVVTMVVPRAKNGVRLVGLSHVVDATHGADPGGDLQSARLRRLDDLPALAGVRIDAIKLDVEDHERYVFRGAAELIRRDRPLIYCELWGKENRSECLAFLDDLGYRAFVSAGRNLEPYDPSSHRQINVLFVPPEQKALREHVGTDGRLTSAV